MTVPLIEGAGDVEGSSRTGHTETRPSTTSGTLFSMQFSGGTTVSFTAEEIRAYTAVIQTLLLVYLAYREVKQ